MTAVLNPSSTRPNAALRPAPPAPTTTASYVWSTTGYCLEMASVLTFALSCHGEAEVLDLLSCWG